MINHLWQSTLFAVVAGLLAAALRKNRAQVRYWIWFSASLKFFAPFVLLMSLGTHLQWAPSAHKMPTPPAVTFTLEQIAQPFSETLPLVPAARNSREWIPIAVLGAWAFGFLGVALIRLQGWLRIRAAIRASTPMDISAPVEVRSSPGLLEPGVVGVFRPILLLPDGIARRLTPPQLESVLAHELCHVRRRDNLFAAVHMVVEAGFWFHPLVWWIGARLVEEREGACDEAVLSLGSEPRVYAEAILNVCKLYVESPLVCVSGVTGSNIKKRIEAIMTNRIVFRLNFGRKLALAVAGLAALTVPILVGMLNAPIVLGQSLGQSSVQSQPPAASPAITLDYGLRYDYEIDAAPVAPSRTPQLIAQAQPAPLPGGRGGGMTPQSALRLDDAQAKFGTTTSPMARMYIRYGPPDQIDDRGSDAQIWRYNYLEDFQSNVEFEFAPGKTMHINFPLPATFYSQPGVAAGLVRSLPAEFFHGSEPTAENTIAGLPGGRASMQIYPARYYRILSAPMDSLSGPIDVFGIIRTSSGEEPQSAGRKPAAIATVRDYIKFEAAPAGPYTANFTLDAGSYICNLVVREQNTGRMFGETINFEVK
jgi:beta-lactamase regulating signal transducer with metallopeptidase domain